MVQNPEDGISRANVYIILSEIKKPPASAGEMAQ